MSIFEESMVFANFAELSKHPRESANEKEVSDYIKSWAEDHGLEVSQDEIWNLIIKKPASAGYEGRDPVIIQAHLDMVCEKNSESSHDFTKDPIKLVVDGDWLRAYDTTLGADNGIGVAIAMTVLEDNSIAHPPLEVVFTVQEETTFEGAANVDKSELKAHRMINLDHSIEHQIIVGSCGGVGVNFTLPVNRSTFIDNAFKITLSGLKGGHSGEDIHRGRGNALLLLLRLVEATGCPLVSIDGGTNRLAIPREGSAVVSASNRAAIEIAVKECEKVLRNEYRTAPELRASVEPVDAAFAPLDNESFARLRAALRAYPNGVVSMFADMEGIVESSDNVGIIETYEGSIKMVSEIRGAYTSKVDDILETIKAIAAVTGAEVETFAPYIPWELSAGSALTESAMNTYKEMYGEDMKMLAVHAGLECGFFAAEVPELDIISVGPDCENFHSPQERVNISSTCRVYDFLTKLLAKL